MESFFLKKLFEWVTYEKIKIEDGIDMKVQENLSFVNFNWHGPSNPTTLKDES
jgi:hypothetical protein